MVKVMCYPVVGKQKSAEICQAFAQGCGGVVVTGAATLRPGPAFFWGVDSTNVHLWRQARDEKYRDYYYGDNSYFDSSRKQYFRVTQNRLQHDGLGWSNGHRFAKLEIEIKPWQPEGKHIVVCPQSDDFMTMVVGKGLHWEKQLPGFTREVRLRSWSRDKTALAATLEADLVDAYALITWSSAAAITAVLNGIPVVCLGQCAASRMGGTLEGIDALPKYMNREHWAGTLADNQWTLEEMRSGECWEGLRKSKVSLAIGAA